MKCQEITFSGHAIRRMFERCINESAIEQVALSGEIILEYPDDRPYPSYLLLGYSGRTPIHVLIGWDQETNDCYVITTYIPSLSIWSDDYRSRREA